jgi:hypothetical protein
MGSASHCRRPGDQTKFALNHCVRPETWVTHLTGHMGDTSWFFAEPEVWMPWKESSVMEERLRFVARLLDGEPMTDVCREFGISRKTGVACSLRGSRRLPGRQKSTPTWSIYKHQRSSGRSRIQANNSTRGALMVQIARSPPAFTWVMVRDNSSARCTNVRPAAQVSASLSRYTILCGPGRTNGGPSPVTRHRSATRQLAPSLGPHDPHSNQIVLGIEPPT